MTWETVVTKNIGLDIGIFNNRLNISADAYIRDTKDMLMPGKALPSVYGAKSPNMNAADLRTKGWELVVAWNDRFNVMDKPFNYGVSFGIGIMSPRLRNMITLIKKSALLMSVRDWEIYGGIWLMAILRQMKRQLIME